MSGPNEASGAGSSGPRPLPSLSDEHLAYLSAAAITPDIAASAGVYTATEIADLPRELQRWEHALPGIVFPWWRASSGTGPINDNDVLWQLRPDQPLAVVDKTTGKTDYRKYLFPLKAELAINAHPLMRQGVHTASAPLVIVEGTKQTLAAVSALAGSEFAVVGMSGCYGWSTGGQPIADLKAIPWRQREVLLCMDADVAGNRDVWEAASRLRDWLEVQGAAVVRLLRLPGGGTTGLDDVLAQTLDPRDAMETLIEKARAAKLKTEKWPSRPPKKRADEHFDEDGGLLTDKIATALLAEHPCARAQDDTIAVYDGGRYRIDRDGIMPYVVDMLGDKYRSNYLATIEHAVISKLKAEKRVLTDRPDTPLLNVRNGMLNLETLELLPHDPEYLSTVQLAVDWDPAAVCPTYDSWLPSVLGKSQIADIEETAAQMFDMMHTPTQSMFLFGPSRSGKSTFLRLMEAVMGRDNTSGVTLHELTDNDFSRAELYGKKLNIAADLSSKHIDDLSVWKRLTGDDLVSANRKHGAMFAFRNQALFAFAANELPSVGESSRAYFARIRAFHFAKSFEGSEDPKIEDRMSGPELTGIFRRWIQAYQRVATRGHRTATDPAVATLFETQSDRVRLWVDEELQIVTEVETKNGPVATSSLTRVPPGYGLATGILYEEFVTWARENGYTPLGRRKFTERLTSINGVIQIRLNPTATRALNLIKKKEDPDTPCAVATVATKQNSLRGNNTPSTTESEPPSDILPYTEEGFAATVATNDHEHDPLAPLPADGPAPVAIDFSVVSAVVYAAIAASPMITLKALQAELSLSADDLRSEIEHLERGGALRRRTPRRGFDVLAPIVERQVDYRPCADPEWVNTTGDMRAEPSDRQLLKFDYSCVMCGEPDDELSEYFPVCEQCRTKAGE